MFPMYRKICRNAALAATALIAAALAPLAAQAADAAAQPQPQPLSAAQVPAKTPVGPAAPSRKATAEQRAQAERLDPLARAAFWAHETDVDPADATAGIRLAAALRALGQYAEAAQSAQRVLTAQPDNLDALLELARAFVGQGQGFYAIEPAKHAQVLAARDWRPLSLLGVAYDQIHRNDDAAEAWRQALALSPDNPAVLSNMAMALAAQGDAAQAEALLRRAVAQPGATLQVRENLTLVLGLQGKLAEAEALLRQNLPPEQAEANLAYLQAISSHEPAASPSTTPARSWEAVRGAGG
jgi:Flp pilus assembly protein TadD